MTDPSDPAVVRSPFGPEVDGRRLLGEAVGFGRSLRAARLSIDLGAAVDFARALTLVDIADREQVRAAGAAIFVRRRDDRPTYDAAFDRWWRRRGRPASRATSPRRRCPARTRRPSEEEMPGAAPPEAGERARRDGDPTSAARRSLPTRDDGDDEAPIEGVVVSPDAYSQGEVLRHREFDRMTPAELREAERLVDLLVPRLERRRTRRYELHSHGRRLAPRAMFRRNLGTGGQLLIVGLAAADPRAALARRAVRHLGLDGAPFAAAAALRPGALGGVGGADRVVRVRDAADARDPAAARPRPRPRARPRRRFGQRLGRRDADRRVVPDLQPEVGAAVAADVGGRHRRVGRLGPRRPGARRRPRPPACGATATGWSGSTRWPARPATSRSPAGCAPPTRTSTTSCRPGRSPRSSGSARSSAASGRATRGGGARRPRTRHCPGSIGPTVAGATRPSSVVRPSTRSAPRPLR